MVQSGLVWFILDRSGRTSASWRCSVDVPPHWQLVGLLVQNLPVLGLPRAGKNLAAADQSQKINPANLTHRKAQTGHPQLAADAGPP